MEKKRRSRKVLLALLTLGAWVMLAGCPPRELEMRPAHVTFLHMNDLHAHLVPHQDLVRTGNGTAVVERGGLARLATLVKKIRLENPNNVLMNIGDTFHGGVEARFTLGNAIVDPVNALKINIGVPGNWDFAFDSATFLARFGSNRDPNVKRPNYPNLGANITNLVNQPVLPATKLVYLDGAYVGFIGITSDIVPMMHQALSLGFNFVRGETQYRDLINHHARQLRNRNAVIVVVMSELGLHKNKRLADVIEPGLVDVFFTGHTHEETVTPINSVSGAWVVEAGNDGYLGRMDIHVDETKVLSKEWQLIPIDSSLAEDPQMKQLVDSARAPFLSPDVNMLEPAQFSQQTLTQPINTVVGSTNLTLDRRHALEHMFNNSYTDWLRITARTDVALAPGFRFEAVVPGAGYLLEDNSVATGNITIEDVYRFIPVHFTMGLAEASGIHLRRTLEGALTNAFGHDSFAHDGGWFAGLSGLSLQVNLNNPDGSKITSMRLKDTGALVTDTTVLTVAGCIRPLEFKNKLCSFPGFSKYVELINPNTSAPYTGTDFMIESLKTNLIHAYRNDIRDMSGIRLWPSSDYMQPIGLN